MTDLRLTRSEAMENASFTSQPAAHAAACRHIENRIASAPRTVQSLTQRGHVAIVLHEHGHPGQIAQPLRQRKIIPASEMVGLHDLPRAPIDRPAVAHANRLWRPLRQKLRQCPRDALANALRAAIILHRETPPLQDHAVASADDQLQFRATDLDGEKAGNGSGISGQSHD